MTRPSHTPTTVLLPLLTTLLLTNACSNDPTTPTTQANIRGRVVNTQGRPVANASILITYEVTPATTTSNKSTRVFEFSLPTPSQVRLWITDPCDDQVVRVLLDEMRPAGNHAMRWNGRDENGIRQVSGLYIANLEADTLTRSNEFFLSASTYAQYLTPTGLDHFAQTDADGHFSINQDCLALDREWLSSSEDGPSESVSSSRRITLWAIHENHGAASSDGSIVVDPKTGADVLLSFSAQSEIRAYAAAHWSEGALACAYAPVCTANPYLDSLGDLYYPVGDYTNLPFWVSPQDDEPVFLENIGRWNQLVFGWDDFLRPEDIPSGNYQPGDPDGLNNPGVSTHREVYQAMLQMAKSRGRF